MYLVVGSESVCSGLGKFVADPQTFFLVFVLSFLFLRKTIFCVSCHFLMNTLGIGTFPFVKAVA